MEQGMEDGATFASRLGDATEAELVAVANGTVAVEVDLEHLLAHHGAAVLVGEGGEDLVRGDVDHLAGGGVGKAAVEAERDPAGLVAERDAEALDGRHDGGVENVDTLIGRIGDP